MGKTFTKTGGTACRDSRRGNKKESGAPISKSGEFRGETAIKCSARGERGERFNRQKEGVVAGLRKELVSEEFPSRV